MTESIVPHVTCDETCVSFQGLQKVVDDRSARASMMLWHSMRKAIARTGIR
jgi:hypothetical protein